MEERQFNVGDQVVFKTWEELKAEYGLKEDYNAVINCEFSYTDEMEERIDKEKIYTIAEIAEKSVTFTEEPSEQRFMYSLDMIKLATESDKVEKVTPVFFNWNFTFSPEIREELNLNPVVDLGKNIVNQGYAALLNALLMGTGLKVRLDYGRHSDIDPVDIYNYCSAQSAYNHFCMIEYGCLSEKDKYDDWARENQVDVFELCGCYVYARNGVMIILANEKATIYTDDFAFSLIQVMHDFWNIASNDELYSYILARDYEAANYKINSFINLAIDAKKRKEFDEQIESLAINMEEITVKRYVRAVEDKKRRVIELENNLRSAYGQLREAKKNRIYYEMLHKGKTDDDFINLLKSDYDNITRIYTHRDYIYVFIKQPLLFFNDEDWTPMRDNYKSSNKHIQYLLDALFTRKAQILLEQAVCIDFDDCCVSRHCDWNQTVGLPNPHIKGYDCWGDNKCPIEEALRSLDYDVAYNQIKSSIAGINLTDKPVMDKFCSYLGESAYEHLQCITDLETGIVMTIPEAEKYYKEKENSAS